MGEMGEDQSLHAPARPYKLKLLSPTSKTISYDLGRIPTYYIAVLLEFIRFKVVIAVNNDGMSCVILSTCSIIVYYIFLCLFYYYYYNIINI